MDCKKFTSNLMLVRNTLNIHWRSYLLSAC